MPRPLRLCCAPCLLCLSGSFIPMVQPWLRMTLRGRVERKLLQLQIRFQWRLYSNYLKYAPSVIVIQSEPHCITSHEVKPAAISSFRGSDSPMHGLWHRPCEGIHSVGVKTKARSQLESPCSFCPCPDQLLFTEDSQG